MTSSEIIVNVTQAFLRRRQEELTTPREGECLCCYVARLVDELSCDGTLRHALHYRDVVAPHATALAAGLQKIGGYCDCEVLMNGYELRGADPDSEVEVVPPCRGVAGGTVEPCNNWAPIRRW